MAQSYFRVLDPKELERNMPYPPLGALYAAAVLKKQDHQIIFFDSMLSDHPDELHKKIDEVNPDLLLLYDDEFNYLTKMCLSNMRNAALNFIKQAKSKFIPVIVYSSDAADFPAEHLSAGCDAIIYGEGEETAAQVVEAFANNNFENQKFQINGLKFLSENKIHSTAPRRLIREIDLLPDPDYSLLNMEAYRSIWLQNHGYFSLSVSTTRGCPYKCNWCAKPLYGQTYSTHSPKRVAAQFQFLKENFNADHIWITDDIFGLKPGWIKSFSDELKNRGIKISYKCLSRPDLLIKGNTVFELAESGCETIWLGAESGSQKILDAMDKGTTVEQIYLAAEKIQSAGMKAAFFIQFGYSGENWNDIKLTRKMIRDCMPDDIGISVSYPLPGTKFYEQLKREKTEFNQKTNWTDSDDLDPMFGGTYNKMFYKSLHRFVHAEYRIYKILSAGRFFNIHHLTKQLIKMVLFGMKVHLQKRNIKPEAVQ